MANTSARIATYTLCNNVASTEFATPQILLVREIPKTLYRKKDEMRKRNHDIHLRLNDQEYQMLKKNCELSKLTSQQFLRSLIQLEMPTEKPHEDFFETIKQLRYIGNNINQLAMMANKNEYLDKNLLLKELDLLNNQILEIREKVYLPTSISIDDVINSKE